MIRYKLCMAEVLGSSADRRARQLRLLRLELATLVVAAAVPIVLWHDIVLATLGVFRWQIGWFAGLIPSVLMALGLACHIPMVLHLARPADARFYRPAPHAWMAWAVCLYVLGFCLATQTAQLAYVGGPA